LNFHPLRRFGNFDNKRLVPALFHCLMNVCKMNEVVLRDQGLAASLFVMNSDRPLLMHRNFPRNYLKHDKRKGLRLFEETKKQMPGMKPKFAATASHTRSPLQTSHILQVSGSAGTGIISSGAGLLPRVWPVDRTAGRRPITGWFLYTPKI
jgi:hypothetical protein